MVSSTEIKADVFQAQAEQAVASGDWKTAAQLYARSCEQSAAKLALINQVQEGLSSRLEMQSIYTLVGDSLRDTFNAQVVMISQYDPATNKVFHHYAIERGQHLNLTEWMPIDSSRAEIIRTRKPFMINLEDILKVLADGRMAIIQGTDLPKTWLGVPMLVGNTACGVVSLQNLDIENAFSKADINLLMTLTSSMTLSLENARLFNQTEQLLSHLEEEMLIARKTQESILPIGAPKRRGYEFSSMIIPARAVGGDFYDFIPLGSNKLGIVIGDVSDKGLPASLFMALSFSLIRAESEHSSDPARILLNVNRYLRKMNASGMYVTLLYSVLDYQTGLIQYARAGHPLPILLDGRGKQVEVTMGVGQPLGLFDNVVLDVQTVELTPGGMALLFSDGINESVDESGEQFGLKRVAQVAQAYKEEKGKAICEHLWEAVKEHGRATPYQDDFTVLVIKRSLNRGI